MARIALRRDEPRARRDMVGRLRSFTGTSPMGSERPSTGGAEYRPVPELLSRC